MPDPDNDPKKTIANTLVREPLMITLPLALALATVVWKLPGGAWSDSDFAALFAALVISLLVWAADVGSMPAAERRYLYRLIYVVFNTLIVAGLLTQVIDPQLFGL
jgi:predicted neutral ceramidase superfamily lipid hydrolase